MATRRAAAAYASLDHVRLSRDWTFSELIAGATSDLGDVSRLLLTLDGTRPGSPDREAIGRQLADLFWDIIVLADRVGIDLASVITSSMHELAEKVEEKVQLAHRQ